MAYALEVDMIAKAHAKDMLTTPYVFSADEAVAMARAGASADRTGAKLKGDKTETLSAGGSA
jgi:predicted TIM-barrel enzyme